MDNIRTPKMTFNDLANINEAWEPKATKARENGNVRKPKKAKRGGRDRNAFNRQMREYMGR